MPLRMLAIHGSARQRGNSWTLLDQAVTASSEARPDLQVETVRAYEARVDPCIACGECEEDTIGCARKGDGWAQVETALREADVFLMASPVYFLGLPAPVKAIIDRLQAMWWYREGGGQVATNQGSFRRAGLILVAAGEDNVFRPSQRMAVAAFNTLGFQLEGELLVGGLEGPGEASNRPDVMAQARDLGARLVA